MPAYLQIKIWLGFLCLSTALLWLAAGTAPAATLKANYQLDGRLSSEVAEAPDLSLLGPASRFVVESVDGTRRKVLAFPKSGGLSLATTGLVDPRNHSIVMLFRLADVSGWRRILDFTNGASDSGFYNRSGKADIYAGGSHTSAGAVFAREAYAQVAFTNEATSDGQRATGYVNGTPVVFRTSTQGFDLDQGVLRLFKDNTSGGAGDEESAGALACLLVYDGVLTAADVEQLAADESLCPAPPPKPGQATARAVGKPRASGAKGPVTVDTGVVVNCPIGPTPCRANGSVRVLGKKRSRTPSGRLLGRAAFNVQAGVTKRVTIRLSRGGARLLRKRGTLRVVALARITPVGADGSAGARATGLVEAPRPPAFQEGVYSGTTSQGLAIVLTVRDRTVQSVFFRWRARCSDGRLRTSAVSLTRGKIRRGRFSLGGALKINGSSARVAGNIRGRRAWGRLWRKGPSPSGAKCVARGIRWQSRVTAVENEAPPFKTYRGTTSQGLPISFLTGAKRILILSFGWRARCEDGMVHTNTISLGGGRIRNGRFSLSGRLTTGGFARVRGRIDGSRASGVLSRRAGSAFGTDCLATGVRWKAGVR